MENFELDELKIEIEVRQESILIKWLGKTRHTKTERKLVQYLNELTKELANKTVLIDFTQFQMMSSSTIPILINLFKDLFSLGAVTTVHYDKNQWWQKASFEPLTIIAESYANIVAVE